jgi:hypothetical protein
MKLQRYLHIVSQVRMIGCALSIACASLIFAPLPAAAAGFCETAVVGNWVKPLEELPRLGSVPADHRLPFGPPGVYIYPGRREGPSFGGQIRTQKSGGTVGFTLVIPPRSAKDGNPNLQPLGWLATTKLTRLDRGGRVRQLLGFRRRRVVGPASNGSFAFDQPETHGIYRVEIVFRNLAGKRLGRFGEYFRVAPAVSDARLTLNAASYGPGETLSACLENLGTGTVTYGGCVGGDGLLYQEFAIEVFDGSVWGRSSIDPTGSCAGVGLGLVPAKAAKVGTFMIPTNAPPGLYRAAMGDQGQITAEFQVVAPTPIDGPICPSTGISLPCPPDS